jgi:hypothetical protein
MLTGEELEEVATIEAGEREICLRWHGCSLFIRIVSGVEGE